MVCQRLEQRLGVLQVGGVEALGKPAVVRGQQLVRLGTAALTLPQPSEAHRRPHLQGLSLLPARHLEGLMKGCFAMGAVIRRHVPLPGTLLASCPNYLCQRPLGLGQPEGHLHGTIHLDGSGQLGASLLTPTNLAIQRAEAQVAVGLERAHAE
jgi:hypothetical protein